jgi:folate-dependent phosphoribosylglycinamide formyltransferase PurN
MAHFQIKQIDNSSVINKIEVELTGKKKEKGLTDRILKFEKMAMSYG